MLWDVAAEVEYPAGRGVLLRGRNGIDVGDHLVGTGEQAVKAATRLVLSATHLPLSSARSARVTLRMPSGVNTEEMPPGDLRTETIWKLGDAIA